MNTDALGCGIGIMGSTCIGVCKTLYNVHDDIFRVGTGVDGHLRLDSWKYRLGYIGIGGTVILRLVEH